MYVICVFYALLLLRHTLTCVFCPADEDVTVTLCNVHYPSIEDYLKIFACSCRTCGMPLLADGLEVCAKQTKLTLSHVVEELERECIDNQVRDQVRKALDFISTTPRDIAHAYDLVLAVTNKRMNMHFKICKLAGCGATDLFQPLVGGI